MNINEIRKFTKNIFISIFDQNCTSTFEKLCLSLLFLILLSGRVSSQNFSALCDAGMELEKAGNIDAAINKYSDAISIKPEKWKGYYYRAKAYYSKANYNDAIADITKAIILSPNDNELNEIKGNCYLAKEKYSEALSDYNIALSNANNKDVKYFLTYFSRGKTLFYLKRHEDAIVDFTHAIKLGKTDPKKTASIYSWRGFSYIELSKFSEAGLDFNNYLSFYPNDLRINFYLGFCYNKSGETEKAKANALKIIGMDPSKEIYFSGVNLLDLYNLDMRRKIVKESLLDAAALVGESKSSPSKTLGTIKITEAFSRLDKAWLYSPGVNKNDNRMKDTILKKMFELYPQMKNKPELPELARKYMVQANNATEEKKYNDAIKLIDKALSIAPYYALAYFNRALLKETLTDYNGAIADTKKYLELNPDASNARVAQDKIYEWEGKVIKNKAAPDKTIEQSQTKANNGDMKPQFIMRGGLNIPKYDFAKTPNSQYDTTFLDKGNMGAQTGYYFEIGLGLKLVGKSKVKFYYNPLILAYSKNNINWSKLGIFFADATIYKKPLRMIEVAQRYGISYEPVQKLILAAYYRPGVVIPLDFSVYYKGNGVDSTIYLMDGEMAGPTNKKAPSLMMSHSFGFTVSYSFVSISYESYFAQPTYEIRLRNNGPNPTNLGDFETRSTVKIPFRTNKIGIVLTF